MICTDSGMPSSVHDLGCQEGGHEAGDCGQEAQQHVEHGAAEEIEGSQQSQCVGGFQGIHGHVAAVVGDQVLVVL